MMNGKVYLNMAQVARLVGKKPWQIQQAIRKGELKSHATPREGAQRVEAAILIEDAQKWALKATLPPPEARKKPAAPQTERMILQRMAGLLEDQNRMLGRLLELWEPQQ